ncbi:hypothetical protein Aperf_G00000087477 [Anoplocephala perfoliata]
MDDKCSEVPSSNIAANSVPPEPEQTYYFGWLKSTFSQSADVWNSIKRDISEVAQSVAASNSISAAKDTASSVYRQLSGAVQSLQQEGAKAEPIAEESDPVNDYPVDEVDISAHFSNLKSSFTGIMSALEKGISELTGGSLNFNFGASESCGSSSDNREARLEVIRADAATYEESPLTTQKDVFAYTEWCAAYFDESTCCPRPGIPIFEGDTIPEEAAITTTTTYSPPAQVLEESPVVRSHLLRLVDPDGDSANGICESDFWSRYYYRVWCLDVLELRRSRLARINVGNVNSSATVNGRATGNEASISTEGWPGLEVEEEGVPEGGKTTKSSPSSNKEVEVPEAKENCPSLPKESDTDISSPASSVILITKADVAEIGNELDEEDEEEDLTQHEPRDSNDSEDEAIQLTADCLQEEASKMKKELGESDGDKSETGSDWEKWN